MTERRPLVRVNGETRQLSAGDTLPADVIPLSGHVGASGGFDCGGAAPKPAGTPTIDFGKAS